MSVVKVFLNMALKMKTVMFQLFKKVQVMDKRDSLNQPRHSAHNYSKSNINQNVIRG